jgi:peptidoglycan/LPS O-acetylase OafA/YrhL
MSPPPLKSLNAARVFAEFWVVHLHFMADHSAAMGILVEDLMSFFFVLSGFVMTYTHRDDDLSDFVLIKAFWWNRIRKMYPVFLIFWVLGVVLNAADGLYANATRGTLLCHVSQLFMMSGWLGCESNLVNGVSWYLHALFWMWLAFPWLLRLQLHLRRTPLPILSGLSMGLILLFRPLGYWKYAPLPPARVVEFYMGGVAALSEDEPKRVVAISALLFLVLFYVGIYYLELFCKQPCTTGLWSFAGTCLIDWSYAFPTKFAWLWVHIIHWLASTAFFTEDHNNTLLQTLSSFSLHLYLGHAIIHSLLSRLSVALRSDRDWGLHTLFLAVYGLSYGCKLLLDSCSFAWC